MGPLWGRRVVVTRAQAQAGALAEALEVLGARITCFPAIRIDDPADPAPLRRAAAGTDRFDWIVFTSVNAVARFVAALPAGGGGTSALGGARVCAVGPATARALAERGIEVHLVPEQFVTEGVVRALMRGAALAGSRVLLPRAAIANPLLPRALREAGARVVEVEAYRTVVDGSGADGVRALLGAGEVDWVAFTSGSTVRAFTATVGGTAAARVASIGPATSAAAAELGIPVHAEAREHTTAGLVAAILETDARGR